MEWLFGKRVTLQERYEEVVKDLRVQSRKLERHVDEAEDEAKDLFIQAKNAARQGDETTSRQLLVARRKACMSALQYRSMKARVDGMKKTGTLQEAETLLNRTRDRLTILSRRAGQGETEKQKQARADAYAQEAVKANKHYAMTAEAIDLADKDEEGAFQPDVRAGDTDIDSILEQFQADFELDLKANTMTVRQAQKKGGRRVPAGRQKTGSINF